MKLHTLLRLALTTTFLLEISLTHAQPIFKKRLNFLNSALGDRSICRTYDQGVIVTGYHYSDIYTAQLNTDGTLNWAKKYDLPDSVIMFGNAIKQTNDGGYIYAGYYDSTFAYDFISSVLMKTNQTGNPYWVRYYNTPFYDELQTRDVIATSDSGYLICGSYITSAGGWWGIFDDMIIKTDYNGSPVWSIAFDQSLYEQFFSVVELPNGDYILGGVMDGSMHMVRIDQNGNVVWNRRYYSPSGLQSSVQYIIRSSDGNLLVTGYASAGTQGDGYLALIKMDYNGDIIWSRGYEYNGNSGIVCAEWGHHITEVNGDILVSGYVSHSPNSGMGGLLLRTESNGILHSSTVLIDNQHMSFAYQDGDTVFAYSAANNADMMIYRMDKNFTSCQQDSVPLDMLLDLALTIDSVNVPAPSYISVLQYALPVTSSPYTFNIPTMCAVTDVEENELENLVIYPNPATDFIRIYIDKKISCNVQISTVLGEAVKSFTSNDISQAVINVSDVSPGIYLVTFSDDLFSVTKKIIVTK